MQPPETISDQFLTEFHKDVRARMPTVPQDIWETVCNMLPGFLGERLYPPSKRSSMQFIFLGSGFGRNIGLPHPESEIFGAYFMNRASRNTSLNSSTFDPNAENAIEALVDNLIKGNTSWGIEQSRPLRSAIKNAAGAIASYLIQSDLKIEDIRQLINHHIIEIGEQRAGLNDLE